MNAAPLRHHVFVCVNARPPFAKPSCGPQNAHETLMRLQETVDQRGLAHEVKITACSCLGPCEDGPVLVVYPKGVWYTRVAPDDVEEIVDLHIKQGKPVERLRYHWPENV